MYFDSCYIAKFYLNEPDSRRVREVVRRADGIISSVWAFGEFHGVLHRRLREGLCSRSEAREFSSRFIKHIQDGLWRLVPVSEALMRRTGALMLVAPQDLFLRTADAVHLVTAQDAGEAEVRTNDRHMLAAAGYFGLVGRSI